MVKNEHSMSHVFLDRRTGWRWQLDPPTKVTNIWRRKQSTCFRVFWPKRWKSEFRITSLLIIIPFINLEIQLYSFIIYKNDVHLENDDLMKYFRMDNVNLTSNVYYIFWSHSAVWNAFLVTRYEPNFCDETKDML